MPDLLPSQWEAMVAVAYVPPNDAVDRDSRKSELLKRDGLACFRFAAISGQHSSRRVTTSTRYFSAPSATDRHADQALPKRWP